MNSPKPWSLSQYFRRFVTPRLVNVAPDKASIWCVALAFMGDLVFVRCILTRLLRPQRNPRPRRRSRQPKMESPMAWQENLR